MLPSLTQLIKSQTYDCRDDAVVIKKWPLVVTNYRLCERITKAYEEAGVFDDLSAAVLKSCFTEKDATAITETIELLNNKVAEFNRCCLFTRPVGEALLRLVDALKKGQPIDRKIEAYGMVLASIAVTNPSASVNYTSSYNLIATQGYKFDRNVVDAQDALVEACLLALSQQPDGQRERRSGFHAHDASLKSEPIKNTERVNWWKVNPGYKQSIPVPLTLTQHCFVYTCGDRPEPLSLVGEFLYGDDSLLWTHQSRFWSYPCWGKPWSSASQRTMCTRFVISLEPGTQLQCFPMDMSQKYQSEVHIIEAPLHLGCYLDSLVLYDPEGITLLVTDVLDNVVGEYYSSEIHCRVVERSQWRRAHR